MFLQDKKLSAATAVAAVALGVCLSQPAQANDARTYVQDFFGGVSSDVNRVEAQRMASLDNDRAEVDSRIASALSAGRITPVQAAELRAQLLNNRTVQLQLARDGRFSFSDNERISTSLTTINGSLQNAIATNGPINPRPNSWFAPRGMVSSTQVNDLQNKISMRIHNGRQNGRLTRSEFQTLREELASIDARKQQMMSPRGMLTFTENQRLLSRLNQLQDKVRVDLHDSQVAGRNYPWY